MSTLPVDKTLHTWTADHICKGQNGHWTYHSGLSVTCSKDTKRAPKQLIFKCYSIALHAGDYHPNAGVEIPDPAQFSDPQAGGTNMLVHNEIRYLYRVVQGFFDDDLAPTLLLRGKCSENKNPLPLPDFLSATYAFLRFYCCPPPHRSFPKWTSIQSQRGDPLADQWPCNTSPPPCCVQTDRQTGHLGGSPRGEGEVGGGSYSRYICHAKEVLAPNRHQKIPVPLYIPYFFMLSMH